MSGEHDINVLLRSLAPVLDDRTYVFATGTEAQVARVARPLGVFHEDEGVSIVCHPDEAASLGLRPSGMLRRITLTVHSSLDAVGLTAHVARALAAEGIACNVVAAYFHDHVFVPADRAHEALHVLLRLQTNAGHECEDGPGGGTASARNV